MPRARVFSPRRRGWCLLLALGALVAACRGTPPGVQIDLRVDDEQFRPTHAQIYWMRPGRVPFEIRLPEFGDFAANVGDPNIGSLYIETVGALREPRAVAVRGFRGEREISGGTMRIETSSSDKRRVLVVLSDPLPDDDQNGTPDVVDRDCLDEVERTGCIDLMPVTDAG
ncbi:MAG TPA: hypothetical protein VGF45_15180, partial [Polyangia bacterium]